MPQIYPTDIPSDSPDSEAKVFRSLEAKLPDDWIVIHGTPVFELPRGRHGSKEGEIDFVIIHPRRGVLVLEVKGGGIGRDERGFWSRDRYGNIHPLDKEPSKQVQGAMHSLMRLLKDKRMLPEGLRAFAWGLSFPDMDMKEDLSLGVPRELIMDRKDLDDPRASIERIFEAHSVDCSEKPKFLPGQLVRAIAPCFELAPSLAGRFDDEHLQLLRLTEEQTQCLDLLEAHEKVVVEGAAGTGKTVIAMEKARRASAAERRTIFLCFNSPLADHLADKAEGFKVRTFHAFCKDMAKAAGLPFQPPRDPEEATEFWNTEAPDILARALDRLPDERYESVIVDEGQDFKELWWLALEKLLDEESRGEFYVFLDPRQNIYGGELSASWGVSPIKLTINCRNTVSVAKYSAAFVGIEARTKSTAPDGVPVAETRYSDKGGAEKAVRKCLHGWINEQGLDTERVAVLTTDAANKGTVRVGGRFGNFELIDAGHAPEGQQIRTASLFRFKGLEADAILLFVSEQAHLERSEHMYVASSRARHALHVVMPQAAG